MDDLDGAFARQYDMVTKFGDYLDHGCDILTSVLLLVVIYVKFGIKYTIPVVLLYIAAVYHISCQEATVPNDIKSKSIGAWCVDTQHAYQHRYMGCGNIMCLIAIGLVIIGITTEQV